MYLYVYIKKNLALKDTKNSARIRIHKNLIPTYFSLVNNHSDLKRLGLHSIYVILWPNFYCLLMSVFSKSYVQQSISTI